MSYFYCYYFNCRINRQSHTFSYNFGIIVHVTFKIALGYASCNYAPFTSKIIPKLYSNATITFIIPFYSVTKILLKICATTFTENYGKLHVRGMSTWKKVRCFQLVLVAQPFTCSLPARIQMIDTTQSSKNILFWFTQSKPL